MPSDTSVKFLHSAMPGAPVLSGTAGAMIALLDACLVDGFGAVTPDSITISGGVATITRAAGLPFEPHCVALITGATVTGGSINGQQKIVSTGPSTATFDATGIANQTAGGTISVRLAPLGWAKSFSGTNLAAYRSADPASTGCYLRVDDTGTTTARARGYETMSDITNGVGPFPRDAVVSGGLWWPKSDAAGASARPWVLVGDGRIFYLMVAYTSGSPSYYGFNHVFGDIAAVKSPDAYACVIHGLNTSAIGTAGANASADFDDCNGSTSFIGTCMPRSYAGLGADISMRKSFPLIAGNALKSGTAGMPYPNYADGGLYLSQFNLIEHGTAVYRGAVPGFYGIPHSVGAGVFVARDLLTGVTGYAGKSFRAISSATGAFAFDVTGPWR